MIDAEKINPYKDDEREKTEQVRDMFDNISPAYDFMNRAMTFGIDKLWRRKAVNIIKRDYQEKTGGGASYKILDIATGTGDVAMLLGHRLPQAQIRGIDLSEGMIGIGRKRIEKAGLAERITLEQGDCLQLPYGDNEFDCITVAYGVRNFSNLVRGYGEMLRVLKPGGLLCVIELATPVNRLVLPFYNLYTRCLIPIVGQMVSKDTRAYAYLAESIAAVPKREGMTALMAEAGFPDKAADGVPITHYLPMTFGVCIIYTSRKG